jgi:putative transposase
MNRSYKFRIYPTTEQQIFLAKTFGCCRFVYNLYLAQSKQDYETERLPFSYSRYAHAMKELKNEKPFLRLRMKFWNAKNR